MSACHPRPSYRASGRVPVWGLLRLVLILAATSAPTAAILFCLLVWGLYVPVLVALLGGLGAAAAGRLAVRRGHCRSSVLAGLAGLAWGVAVILGSFHLDQCVRWGQPWAAVGQLPQYVAFRMATDGPRGFNLKASVRPRQAVAGQRPVPPDGPRTNQAIANSILLLLQALCLMGGAVGGAIYQARLPYSERTRRWCSRGTRGLTARAERTFWQALAGDTLADWVRTVAQQQGPQPEDKHLVYWYTPADGDAEPDLLAYVTSGWQHLLLTPEEAAALLPVLPGLQTIAGAALPPEDVCRDDGTVARTQAVPGPHRGRLLPGETRAYFECLLWAVIVMPFVLGGVLVFKADTLVAHLPGALKLPVADPALVFQVIGGVVLAAGCLSWRLRGPFHMLRRLENTTIRKRLTARPDPWVTADNPRAFYAEVLARRFWANKLPHQPEDSNVGLVLVDREQGVLLFEGDYERYRIPAGSILSRELTGLPGTTLVAVVLQVRTAAGSTELPFIVSAGEQGTDSPKLAQTLWAQLEELGIGDSGGGRVWNEAELFGIRLPGSAHVRK
jgi:hypothetical protein